jgi:hypothetical protein
MTNYSNEFQLLFQLLKFASSKQFKSCAHYIIEQAITWGAKPKSQKKLCPMQSNGLTPTTQHSPQP